MNSKKIPQKLIGFDPPDYALEWQEVWEMIKFMPVKTNFPRIRALNSREQRYAQIRQIYHPEREVPPIGEEAIQVLYYSVQEMYKIFKSMKCNYSIEKYNVFLLLHTEYDIAEVAFCPKIENWLDGPSDEIGVDFYFKLSNHKLLEKTYMK